MPKSARARYEELAVTRDAFEQRARWSAELTIPGLMPPEGHSQTSTLPQTYQGFGARCVVNLSSRMLVALYPPGFNSFRLDIPPQQLLKAGKAEPDPDEQLGLSKSESLITSEIEAKQWRAPTFLALQYLLVTGNCLEQTLPDNRIKVYRLDQYVVVRDLVGNLIEFVIKEEVARDKIFSVEEQKKGQQARLPLFTWGILRDGKWHIHQEVDGGVIAKSRGTWKINPFRALRWTHVVGEDYGRGKIEEHIGDFRAVEGLSKAIVEGAAMASRNIITISPNAATGGLNLRRRITKAANGEAVVASQDDVGMLQFTNISGMQFSAQELAERKRELSMSFLLNSAVQRDAERVTAYEIRQMTEELEGTLGGIYSMLAQEMQSARIDRLVFQMQAKKQLPDWPDGSVSPTILTGLEALGREQDTNRVATALSFLQNLPPDMLDYIKMPDMLTKAFTGLGLPNMIRSEEEANGIRQQRQMAEMVQQVAQQGGGQALAGAADAAIKGAAGQQ